MSREYLYFYEQILTCREILFPKGHVLHREGPAPQVVQHSGVRGQGEGQLTQNAYSRGAKALVNCSQAR